LILLVSIAGYAVRWLFEGGYVHWGDRPATFGWPINSQLDGYARALARCWLPWLKGYRLALYELPSHVMNKKRH